MSTKTIHNYPTSPAASSAQRFERIVLLDDNSIELFIYETILNAAGIANTVQISSDPFELIDQLQKTEKLSLIPELIFINIEMNGIRNFDFMGEFALLSDFIRSKCKLVVITSQPVVRLMSNLSIVRYLQKPVDLFQLKEFLPL